MIVVKGNLTVVLSIYVCVSGLVDEVYDGEIERERDRNTHTVTHTHHHHQQSQVHMKVQ